MATTTAIFLFLFLGLPYLIAEYLRAIGSDWPATCTPFEGEAQRWKREREQDEAEPERGWGETTDLPPMSAAALTGTDEAYLSAVMSQPEPEGQNRYGKVRKKRPVLDSDVVDTLKRQAEISKRMKEEEKARRAIAPSLELSNRKD